MRLVVHRSGEPDKTVEGAEARASAKALLRSVSEGMMAIDEFDGEFRSVVCEARRVQRRRLLDTLRRGEPVYDKPSSMGGPSDKSTILRMPPKIIGIIDIDGVWHGEGPDPRLEDATVDRGGEGRAADGLLEEPQPDAEAPDGTHRA